MSRVALKLTALMMTGRVGAGLGFREGALVVGAVVGLAVGDGVGAVDGLPKTSKCLRPALLVQKSRTRAKHCALGSELVVCKHFCPSTFAGNPGSVHSSF